MLDAAVALKKVFIISGSSKSKSDSSSQGDSGMVVRAVPEVPVNMTSFMVMSVSVVMGPESLL